MPANTLYERLGGYDAISAVANDLLSRLRSDSRLARFYQHRGQDGIRREKQLLIDYLCANAGGPMYYTGRDMKTAHAGMKIGVGDWTAFIGHVRATLNAFAVPQVEHNDVIAFLQAARPTSLKAEIRRWR